MTTIHHQKSALLQLLLIQIASSTEFHPNCSIPTQTSDFVSSPNVRSTLDILYGSLVTIFLCTWTAQHLCLPPPENKESGYLSQVWQAIWKKLKWMLVAIIMPEFMVGKALGDFIAAYRSSRCGVMQEHARQSNTEWTMTHAFYANMGGYDDKGPTYNNKDMASISLPIAVNSAHLCALISRGLIKGLPSISKIEIEDKSKEDMIVKALTLVQVLWFIIQLAVRKAKNLPCTQLEIAVLGFAICTFITYLLWFKKPKDIKVGSRVSTERELTPDDRRRILWLNKFGFFENALKGTDKHMPTRTMTNDMYNMEAAFYRFEFGEDAKIGFEGEDIGFIAGAVVFGACHCIAWDFEFPTSVEQIVWKAASIFTIAAIPLFYLGGAFLYWMTVGGVLRGVSFCALSYTTFSLYAACRVFIIVELFRSLAYLPPEAFLTTWSASMPHVN
ncbi:hypothetical protein BDZ45DRAFT_590708 [Acephala macrosclerotiorum]|nr:hypothetical protein BDZ45DRAFT_590708 [Acephala macrosclerotiorum]